MSESIGQGGYGPPPRWVIVAGSLAICFHLGLIAVNVWNYPSGPWIREGSDFEMDGPPAFAQLTAADLQGYLSFLKMNATFHFPSNEPAQQYTYFVARLKDDKGKVVEEITLPDANANPWVRHRQERMCRWLTGDEMGPAPQGQKVPSPMVHVFVPEEPRDPHKIRYTMVAENDLPRNQQTRRPGEFAWIAANSYARYLCRTHDVRSVEIVRHTKNALSPTLLFQPDRPPAATLGMLKEMTEEEIASFGDLPDVQVASPRDNRR